MLNESNVSMPAKDAVNRKLRMILDETDLPTTFRTSDRLETIGLKSLDLARLVAELEEELGFDPFAEMIPITSIRTVGDLVEAYSEPPANPSEAADASLTATIERAHARRRRSAEG